MNWLEKLSQKAMALPFPKKRYRGGHGLNRIDMTMTEDTAVKEKERFPEIQYWAAGNNGLVSDIDTHVVKYTRNRFEASQAKSIQQAREDGNPIQCVPQVYEVEEIQEWLWRIIFEKVIPLNKPKAKEQNTGTNEQQRSAFFESPEYFSLKECLTSHGISADNHYSNYGRAEDGRLVLLDLGY